MDLEQIDTDLFFPVLVVLSAVSPKWYIPIKVLLIVIFYRQIPEDILG
jgi:hypothetical protein